MLEKEKIEIMRNLEFINEYLYQKDVSDKIMDNPRYQSILWKISNIMRKMKFKPFSDEAKNLLDNVIMVDKDGNFVMIEGEGTDNSIVSSKYYIDGIDDKLKRLRVQTYINQNKDVKNLPEKKCITISTYNQDGIEESLAVEESTDYGKYFSKATRVPNRIDMIKIERLEQRNDKFNRIPEFYQIRSFIPALEDISPDIEDIDPFDTMHFSIIGLPEIYRDLTDKEKKTIKSMNDKILPLSESKRDEMLQEYKRLNKRYGRTNAYENGIAKYYLVKNKDRSVD